MQSTNDDVEEQVDGSIYSESSDLELTRDGTRGKQIIGLRFSNIDIPQGAKITNSFVQFTANSLGKAKTRLAIHGECSNTPP